MKILWVELEIILFNIWSNWIWVKIVLKERSGPSWTILCAGPRSPIITYCHVLCSAPIIFIMCHAMSWNITCYIFADRGFRSFSFQDKKSWSVSLSFPLFFIFCGKWKSIIFSGPWIWNIHHPERPCMHISTTGPSRTKERRQWNR